ncbi:hypothetical protein PR048_022536 [Dryococelus australis]|uniref:DDE Tnp4 domain-containing protein n=1 Tax=Dryococelus australis TaxID=614101 RepID=A0ABQ9H1B3_9NEOP|nr:hypothetical protein PR048_022536 [Dryococelus australis]
MTHCTVGWIVYTTCDAIWECFVGIHMPFPTAELPRKSADLYEELWDFLDCVSRIDGRHLRTRYPKASGSNFSNYKSFFSVLLQGMVDANIDSLAWTKGPTKDKVTLVCFPTDVMFPYVVLRDQEYPLKEYLMRPYPTPNLNVLQDI